MDCYIFVKFLLTTALLRKLGACRPCTPRRTFGRPAVLYYFFLRQESLPLTWVHSSCGWGVGYGKKIIPFATNASAWSIFPLNHFSFSDYGNFIHDILLVLDIPYDIVCHLLHREYAYISNLQSWLVRNIL